MNVRDLLAILAKCKGDEEVIVWHDRRESPVQDVRVMGYTKATVQGGSIEITETMRQKATIKVCVMVEGWDSHD